MTFANKYTGSLNPRGPFHKETYEKNHRTRKGVIVNRIILKKIGRIN